MQAGKITVLAVTGRQRMREAPDVPTLKEARLSGAGDGEPRRRVWSARHAARRPRADRSRHQSRRGERSHDRDNQLEATGQIFDVRGPAEFAAGIKELKDKLAAIAKVLGMKAATN